jgi:hypothetical protein
MQRLGTVLGRRNQNGAGLPQGLILEIRFLAAGVLAVLLLLGSWVWTEKKERESYVAHPIQQVETAAGK